MTMYERPEQDEIAEFMVRRIGDHAIFFITLDGRIRSWNAGAERIFGWTGDEIIGQPSRLLFTDRDVSEGVPERELELALANGTAEDERWHRRKDGSSVYVSGSTMRLDDDSGRPVGFAKVARDFTARKHNERRVAVQTDVMRVLTEEHTIEAAAPRVLQIIGSALKWDAGSLWIVDERAEMLACRSAWTSDRSMAPAYAELTRKRYRRGRDVLGKVWSDDAPLWLPNMERTHERSNVTRAGFSSAVAFPIHGHAQVIGVVEFLSREPRDRDRDFLAIAATLGTLLGYFIEREQNERALRDASRAKDYLLARVSHDLRAPLTAIKGWAQLLRHRELDPETYGVAVTTIDESVTAQEALIEDLLDVSRIAFGQIRLERDAVDLVEMLAGTVRMSMPAAEAKQIVLQWHAEPQRAMVLADPQRIRQVINNLLSNALKFTPEGGTVTVALTSENGMATITVADTGHGIAADVLPQIFEPFRQVGSASGGPGLGLGLAIVRELVELHGGTVHAYSAGSDAGTTFTIELPMSDDAG